jgi:hypothetical protein
VTTTLALNQERVASSSKGRRFRANWIREGMGGCAELGQLAAAGAGRPEIGTCVVRRLGSLDHGLKVVDEFPDFLVAALGCRYAH